MKREEMILKHTSLPTPCYLLDEAKLMENGRILKEVQEHTGCKILLAQKAFSNYDLYPVLEPYLAGTEASGLYEARLGFEEMPDKECHVFCAAYREDEFEELLNYADHIVFNSPGQLKKFGARAKTAGKEIPHKQNHFLIIIFHVSLLNRSVILINDDNRSNAIMLMQHGRKIQKSCCQFHLIPIARRKFLIQRSVVNI